MAEIFDESIFTTGVIFKSRKVIGVANKADAFLIKRLSTKKGLKSLVTVKPCNPKAELTINPKEPCRGANLYTMKMKTANNTKFFKFNQIHVLHSETPTPIDIIEWSKDLSVFTINDKFTNLEMAIMVKYYSSKSPVNITYELYTVIAEEFDVRNWFVFPPNEPLPIIHNINHELTLNSTLLNKPDLNFYEYELQM